jgi:hypothetical protein
MFKLPLLFIVAVLTGASECADDFVKKVYSDDSLICIESKGDVGEATVHASSKVTLVHDMAELGKFKTVFCSDEKKPYFPIITELQVMGNFGGERVVAFALGWSSFGGGYETFTGWLIRFDMAPSIIDWFEISLPRSFPGIAYDREHREIALLASKKCLATLDHDISSLCLTLSNGKKINIDDSIAKNENPVYKKWIPYNNHPFGKRMSEITVDSFFCVKRIVITETGFEIAADRRKRKQ